MSFVGVAQLISRVEVYIRIIRGEVDGRRRRRRRRRARRDFHQVWSLGERLRVEINCLGERKREGKLYCQRPKGKGLFIVRPMFCSETGLYLLPTITVCLSSPSLCSHTAARGSK